MQQSSFTTTDGINIVFHYWQASNPLERVIILLHRGHEHSARLQEMAQFYCQNGYHVYAWDARGNGLSGGERDAAESFTLLASDLDQFVDVVSQHSQTSCEKIVVIASSVGAVIAASWLHDHAPKIRGIILATPAFDIRLYMPFATQLLTLARYFGFMPRVTSYVKSKVLTHDREQQKIYDNDPLISSGISTDLLLETYRTGERLIDDAGAIDTPILMLCAGKDWVVTKSSQRKFYNRLSSTWKEWRYYPECYHALFHEDSRQDIFQDCLDFITRIYQQTPEPKNYRQADKYGYTKDKYDQINMPSINPIYPLTRLGFKTIGQFSSGIKLGLRTGFDSGQTLDFVYRNQAESGNFLGRLMDKMYLSSPGWEGIRRRKQLLDQELEYQLEAIKEGGKVLDIAAGNGRYLLYPLQNYPHISAQLRDYDEENIQVMSEHVKQLHLEAQVDLLQANAFDDNSYPKEEEFDLIIISGIFELFTSNDLICTALNGVAKQLKTGGTLIYTNQPWHPQQEFIARTLNSHQGKDWSMRCRTQAEMDQLVELSGLQKINTRIERAGIFSVSIAKKQGS